MECFLTNFNPQKRPAEANCVEQREKRKKYETEKRKSHEVVMESFVQIAGEYRWFVNLTFGEQINHVHLMISVNSWNGSFR
jgi:uncharacterized protein with GYD domain